MARRHHTPPRKFVAVLACCVAASALVVGQASARQIFQERYHDEGSSERQDFCGAEGLNVSVDYVIDGKVRAVQRGPNGQAYFLDHLKETEVYTNLANGKTATFVFTGTLKDQEITDNGDGTLTILAGLMGSQVLYGADGKAIARSAGLSTYEFLIDHGGTPTDTSDDVFIADLGIVKAAGRRDDTCAAFVAEVT